MNCSDFHVNFNQYVCVIPDTSKLNCGVCVFLVFERTSDYMPRINSPGNTRSNNSSAKSNLFLSICTMTSFFTLMELAI